MTFRTILSLALSATLVGLVVPARSQTVALDLATRSTEFRGSVPRVCTITGPATSTQANNATLSANGVGSATINITQLVNTVVGDGTSQGATVQFEIPATCTVSHEISIGSANRGLALNGVAGVPDASGFRSSLSYGLTATWSTLNLSGQAINGALVGQVPDAATGSIVVAITIPSGGVPLVAGTYSDALSINLSPTL